MAENPSTSTSDGWSVLFREAELGRWQARLPWVRAECDHQRSKLERLTENLGEKIRALDPKHPGYQQRIVCLNLNYVLEYTRQEKEFRRIQDQYDELVEKIEECESMSAFEMTQPKY